MCTMDAFAGLRSEHSVSVIRWGSTTPQSAVRLYRILFVADAAHTLVTFRVVGEQYTRYDNTRVTQLNYIYEG